tara:strand:- start:320 stop:1084 length:765 start_codon:yes stop_codon:yes gene_type:complete
LGRLDFVVEISEIAVRDFLKQLEQAENKEEFVENKSSEFRIMVAFDENNQYYHQITLGNISAVYHLTETFFYELQTEYNDISNESWSFHSNTKKLDQVISFFRTKNRFNQSDNIDEYLIDTFNYYHQLRIYFSHKKTVSIGEITSKRKKAIKHFDQELLDKYKVKQAPKELLNIDFEDYFLFTQVAKNLALKISSIGFPEPNGLALTKEIKKLNKYKDNKQRLNKSIERALITNFGYIKENDSDDLVEKIIECL